ncbi:MAG TPA: glycosyltransferase family 39 protein, partial [Gemmatimonadales bacterium]
GGSIVAVRFLPAVTGGLLVFLAALIARRLGGGRYAQVLAALVVALSPLFLRAGNLYQPVIFDQLWWTVGLYAVISLSAGAAAGRPYTRPLDPSTSRLPWLLLGAALGLGLLTKFSIAFIGIGIVVAIVITPLRRSLLTPWPWVALLIALVIGSPSLVGQIRLGFPVVGQMHDLQGSQLERVTPLAFLKGQWDMFGPVILLAILGLVQLLRSRYAAAGWAILTTFILLIILKGKPYYVGPIYPTLLAAGAVMVERLVEGRGSRVAYALPVIIVIAFGAISFPFGVPILPPAQMDAYARRIGVTQETNTGEVIALPQDYADMLGWEDQVKATARVFDSLPPAERNDAVILGTNYGRAGANDHLGRKYGLPPSVAPMGSYWFFGPGSKPGKVLIVIGGTREDLAPWYDSVTLAAHLSNPWRVPEEREVDIWVAKGNRYTLQQVWGRFEGEN